MIRSLALCCVCQGAAIARCCYILDPWRLNEAGVLPELDRCAACRGLDHWLDELTSDLDCPVGWGHTTLRRFVDLDLAILLDGSYPSLALPANPDH